MAGCSSAFASCTSCWSSCTAFATCWHSELRHCCVLSTCVTCRSHRLMTSSCRSFTSSLTCCTPTRRAPEACSCSLCKPWISLDKRATSSPTCCCKKCTWSRRPLNSSWAGIQSTFAGASTSCRILPILPTICSDKVSTGVRTSRSKFSVTFVNSARAIASTSLPRLEASLRKLCSQIQRRSLKGMSPTRPHFLSRRVGWSFCSLDGVLKVSVLAVLWRLAFCFEWS
mmetsp:Transcript_85933/g.251559  ORF Transcript_85933/g.251559 Transcript_85933/m.251559 type:complete len:227 (+) Transcript_85933:1796-2476(+)